MTDEKGRPVESAEMTTGVMSAAQLDELESYPVEAPPAEGPPAYVKEPLFSKRVMFGWAIATLAVWFALTVVVPEIVRSVAAEVRNNVTRNDDGTMTIQTRRGRFIIRRDGEEFRVDRVEAGEAAPAAPVGAAPAPAPAVALPAPEPTGKK